MERERQRKRRDSRKKTLRKEVANLEQRGEGNPKYIEFIGKRDRDEIGKTKREGKKDRQRGS